jgi:hypothetical protein
MAAGVNGSTPQTVILFKEDLTQIGFTGRELAAIREHTGKSLSALLGDEEGDDKFIALAWLKLRREGHEIDWDAMLDIVVDFRPTGSAADPQPAPPSTPSPASAISGA